MVVQPDGDPEHHLDQQHGVGDQQWDDQKHVLVFDIKEIGFLWKNQMLRIQNDSPLNVLLILTYRMEYFVLEYI